MRAKKILKKMMRKDHLYQILLYKTTVSKSLILVPEQTEQYNEIKTSETETYGNIA